MANKDKDLEQSTYDPNKDLQKKKKPAEPIEPTYQGNPINS